MKWNSKALSFSLDARDLAIMSQCRMKMDEIIGRTPGHKGVPPLWSVLSYEMLRNQTQSLNQFWKEYRQCELLEKERDRYYSLTCIPKNSTGVRKLHVPDWEISKHQQFMLKEILEHIPVNRCAYAYRKGIGIKNCALPHVNQETVIHLDIKDFFSSITEEMVFKCIERDTGYSKQLVRFISSICCYRGRLPQGACTSPVLSNICFRDCDEVLEQYALDYNLIYTRYSDDLFFSGIFGSPAEMIHDICQILKGYGFTLNQSKTRIRSKNASQRVVGLVVNQKVQVTREYRRALRQELYYLHRFGVNARAAKTAESFLVYLYQLQGKVAFVLSVDPDNGEFQEEKRRLKILIDTFEGANIQDYVRFPGSTTTVQYSHNCDRTEICQP